MLLEISRTNWYVRIFSTYPKNGGLTSICFDTLRMLQLSFNNDDLGWYSCAVQHPPSGHQHPLQAQQHMSPVIVIAALHNHGQVQFLPAIQHLGNFLQSHGSPQRVRSGHHKSTADPRIKGIETSESGRP